MLSALAGGQDRLPVLIGNSGVGKSSLAQAGVLAALKRMAWPEEAQAPNAWPAAFQDSRQWCFLLFKPGTDPLKALVGAFLDTWQFSATDPERVRNQNGWIELLRDGKATLPDLIDATERRRKELDQPEPAGLLSLRRSGRGALCPRRGKPAPALLRAAGAGVARPAPARDDEHALRLPRPSAKRRGSVQGAPTDRRAAAARGRAARDRRPAGETARRRGSRPRVSSIIITRRTAEDSIRDVGALPLLSYTLDDMWTQMVQQGDGTLRLPAQSL